MPEPELFLPQDGQTKANIQKLNAFAAEVLNKNIGALKNSEGYMKQSYWTVYWAYVLMFAFGLLAFGAAVVKGLISDETSEAVAAATIGGLAVGTFVAMFLFRPVESLERNAIFVTWLRAVTNTYWTRLMYMTDEHTIQADLEDATRDLVELLGTLADKHAAAVGKYLPLLETKEVDDQAAGGNGQGQGAPPAAPVAAANAAEAGAATGKT